jgi:hypothetical protein
MSLAPLPNIESQPLIMKASIATPNKTNVNPDFSLILPIIAITTYNFGLLN